MGVAAEWDKSQLTSPSGNFNDRLRSRIANHPIPYPMGKMRYCVGHVALHFPA